METLSCSSAQNISELVERGTDTDAASSVKKKELKPDMFRPKF